MSYGSTPAPPAAPADDKDEPKENVHVKAMQEHLDAGHLHLRAAHSSAGSKAARMHITQAGMALSSLHKSAKQALGAAGVVDPTKGYDGDLNGEYGGRS